MCAKFSGKQHDAAFVVQTNRKIIMNLHEYQAKQLFREFGLPVSEGFAVDTADEAVEAAKKLVASVGLLRRKYTQAAAVKRAA